MANKNRMEWTINPEIDSISGYSGFEEELQFNSTVLGEKNAPSGNPGRRRTRLDSEASFQKRRRLLAEGIVDESVWFVDDTAEFPQGFEENVPPSASNGDSSAESNITINSNDESALDKTVVEEEDLFSSDLEVGNDDLEESSYSRFTLGVPSTSTFIREPSESPESHPMDNTPQEETPTATGRVLRSRNPPTKTTMAAQQTKESQKDSDITSTEESSDVEEPQNPPRIAQKPQKKGAFTCNNCPMQFKSKQGKQLHEYSKHMTPEELKENSISHRKCPHCSRICVQKSDYDKHLLTHNGIKPHDCSLCQQKFSQKENLDRHVKTVHLKQKDFKCTEAECDYKCGLKAHLDMHVKIVHLKQKNFTCSESQCNYKCGQKSNLKVHVAAIHNGIKHECPNCKKKFSFKGNLTTHEKNCRK